MRNELKTYNNILLLGLRPWLNRDVSETKHKEMLADLKKEHYTFQPACEMNFLKPLSPRSKYYYALIENEAISYLNDLNATISAASNKKERKYHVYTALTKLLSQKLKDTEKVIIENDYFLEELSPSTKARTANKKFAEEISIIQFLKYNLIRLYLEIQKTYADNLQDEPITEEELHNKYFSEQPPQQSFIVEVKKINAPKPASQVDAPPEQEPFKPQLFDFRPVAKGIFTFQTIVSDSKKLAQFELKLFDNKLIDQDYNFQNGHGQVNELAAAYHLLIQQGCFNKKNIEKNLLIIPRHIRKFLDHRYNASTDQQFRAYGSKNSKLSEYINSNYWLDNLRLF